MPVIHPNETHPTDVYSMSKKYKLLNTPTVKVGGTFGTMMDQSERVVAIVVEALEEIRKGNYTESVPSADKF